MLGTLTVTRFLYRAIDPVVPLLVANIVNVLTTWRLVSAISTRICN